MFDPCEDEATEDWMGKWGHILTYYRWKYTTEGHHKGQLENLQQVRILPNEI